MGEKMIVGTLEICDLPNLGIKNLTVKVDTGAKTSSIHVDHIEPFKKHGKPWIRFAIHPDVYNTESLQYCECPIHDIRPVKSSNGQSEQRYVIKTAFVLGEYDWPIEITLTDRSEMSYLMLLGREGMADRILVDPSQRFLITSDESQKKDN